MNVTFVNRGIDDMICQIMRFQTEGESDFWSEPLYYFYPQLNRDHACSLDIVKKRDYIENTLREIYLDIESEINEKAALYQNYWFQCRDQIIQALSQAFQMDWTNLFNDLCCCVSMNPIEPRFLREHRFDLFYKNSEKGAIGQCIHEIIHFAWFYVWHEIFQDSWGEYERPSLKWILSEMVVESIMKDSYAYCQAHEKEIRAHIQEAESRGMYL
ncbi:hypothetical protein [Catenibacillus scindens]|uniref:hypothetical protein n=1 Tax=Catenibacillus scindens TaxID=673271 RepID=UPI003208C175